MSVLKDFLKKSLAATIDEITARTKAEYNAKIDKLLADLRMGLSKVCSHRLFSLRQVFCYYLQLESGHVLDILWFTLRNDIIMDQN